MKNEKDDYRILTDFDNLYKAHLSCRKGKRWKVSAATYDMRGLECTLALKDLLDTGRYRLSPYNCFTINERGKKRDIKSIKYHDRVVQKCLMDEILTPTIQKKFIPANAASQKTKGTDYCMALLKKHMRQYVNKHGTDGYILVCDMHKYFDSIPHELVDARFETWFEDEKLLTLIRHIHASIPGGVGVPLGNQLSQLDALIALNELDHILKENWHFKWYARYNDDFYIIHEDIERLREARDFIRRYVSDRGMELNQKKTRIVKLRQGISFLGFHFYVTDTGKVVQKLLKKSINHVKKKMKKMQKLCAAGEVTAKECREAYMGWRAHAQRGNTYYLLRKMDAWFNELLKNEIEKEEKNAEKT